MITFTCIMIPDMNTRNQATLHPVVFCLAIEYNSCIQIKGFLFKCIFCLCTSRLSNENQLCKCNIIRLIKNIYISF